MSKNVYILGLLGCILALIGGLISKNFWEIIWVLIAFGWMTLYYKKSNL